MSACWISLFRSGVGCCCVSGLAGARFRAVVLDFAGVVFFAGAPWGAAAVVVFLGGVFAVWGIAGMATPQTRNNAKKTTLIGNGKFLAPITFAAEYRPGKWAARLASGFLR